MLCQANGGLFLEVAYSIPAAYFTFIISFKSFLSGNFLSFCMWGTIKVLALILRQGSTEYKHVQEGGTDKPREHKHDGFTDTQPHGQA